MLCVVKSKTAPQSRSNRINFLTAAALAGVLVIFLLLRLRWIGHLLVWDEAMNLCTVRSLAAEKRWLSNHGGSLRGLQSGYP